MAKLKTKKKKYSYQPENGLEIYRKKDIIKLAKGNLQYAKLLMKRLTWEYPETLIEQDLNEGEIIEFNGQYILTGDNEVSISFT